MKKISISCIMAVVALFAFSSCDGIWGDIIDQLSGSVTLTIDDPSGTSYYAREANQCVADVTLDCCIGDVLSDTTNISLILGSNIDLTVAVKDVPYPFLGIKLADSVAGSYSINSVASNVTYGNLNIEHMVSSVDSNNNVFVLAISDTSWYIGESGTVQISEYPQRGYEIQGTISNVVAYYVTQHTVDTAIAFVDALTERAANADAEALAILQELKPDRFFPTVTISGNINSRRMRLNALAELISEARENIGSKRN